MKGNILKRPFYTMADVDGDSTEITMYGDIVEQVPRNYWTGEEIPGNYIVMDTFMADLENLKGKKNITIRMNSCGGDAGVAITIHNRLRELAREGKNLVCIVDGMAMSGGSLIMCACDTVQVNPSSLIMIHKCWSFYFGGYNADELRQAADQADAYDNAQVAIYTRKTGLSDTKIRHMMGETTYMTGREAVEKGFADALLEDAEEINFAASADGRTIFMGGRAIAMMPGLFAPDSIPTVSTEDPVPGSDGEANTSTQPVASGGERGVSMNLEELRREHPELVAQIEAAARTAGNAEAAAAAVSAERRRLQEIDAIAAQVPEDLLAEARYGETACSAQELAYRAMTAAAGKGAGFLAGMNADYAASGAGAVGAVPPAADEGEPKTEGEKKDAAKADIAGLFGKKGE